MLCTKKHYLHFTFSKEDVFLDSVLSVIDCLTYLVSRTGQPRTMLLSDFSINSNSKSIVIEQQFMHFQELHSLPDDLLVCFFICMLGEQEQDTMLQACSATVLKCPGCPIQRMLPLSTNECRKPGMQEDSL